MRFFLLRTTGINLPTLGQLLAVRNRSISSCALASQCVCVPAAFELQQGPWHGQGQVQQQQQHALVAVNDAVQRADPDALRPAGNADLRSVMLLSSAVRAPPPAVAGSPHAAAAAAALAAAAGSIRVGRSRSPPRVLDPQEQQRRLMMQQQYRGPVTTSPPPLVVLSSGPGSLPLSQSAEWLHATSPPPARDPLFDEELGLASPPPPPAQQHAGKAGVDSRARHARSRNSRLRPSLSNPDLPLDSLPRSRARHASSPLSPCSPLPPPVPLDRNYEDHTAPVLLVFSC